jgi:hypothetical protein
MVRVRSENNTRHNMPNETLTPTTNSNSDQSSGATAYFPRRDHTIYKPNGRGTGAAFRFSLNRDKQALFVEAAGQSGERQFDWENKIIMKWGLADIGGALAVFQGRMPKAKLFHQTEKANSTFEIVTRDDPERAPYLLAISRQENATKELRKAAAPLTHGEAAVLETALRAATTAIIGW